MKIKKVNRFKGETKLRGDKSISHRAALLSAIADGTSTLLNYSSGADCRSTLNCLKQLGVPVTISENQITIGGRGISGFKEPYKILDAGNSGTTIRLLTGLLAGQKFDSVISGDHSLNKRPMKRIIDPLRLMGADIQGKDKGLPPLEIKGSGLCAIDFYPQTPSAQVKSCVILAGLMAEGITRVYEKVDTRNHTEILLDLKVNKSDNGKEIIVDPERVKIPGRKFIIPGDISSAYFLIIPALLCPGGEVTVKNVGLNPTRTAFLKLLTDMGANIKIEDLTDDNGEPVGTIIAKESSLNNKIEINSSIVPLIIDEVPLLAVLGACMGMDLEIRNAGELRVKESDRIKAIVTNLKNFSVLIEELDDGFRITGGGNMKGAEIVSFYDHRIAMAMTVAAMFSEGESYLPDPDTASISFPEFFDIKRRFNTV